MLHVPGVANPEHVVAEKTRDVDVSAGVHGDSFRTRECVPDSVACRIDDLGNRAGSAGRTTRARSRNLESVVMASAGDEDISRRIQGEAAWKGQPVSGAVARYVDDLGDRAGRAGRAARTRSRNLEDVSIARNVDVVARVHGDV